MAPALRPYAVMARASDQCRTGALDAILNMTALIWAFYRDLRRLSLFGRPRVLAEACGHHRALFGFGRAVAGDCRRVAKPMDLDRQLAFQALDNGAVWASISVAGRREMLQRVRHFVERLRPLPQFGNMLERDRLHLRIAAVAVAPQAQEIADLLDREAKVSRAADERQPVDIGGSIAR